MNTACLNFPKAKGIVVSGDIHEDFTQSLLNINAGWHAKIDDVMFHMLDIMELREIPPKELS